MLEDKECDDGKYLGCYPSAHMIIAALGPKRLIAPQCPRIYSTAHHPHYQWPNYITIAFQMPIDERHTTLILC